MKLWLHIAITLFFQELITMNAVLLTAYQQEYNFVLISLLFIAITIVTSSLGFGLGKWIQKRFSHSKIVTYSERKVQSFEKVLGKKGSRLALIVLGIFNFNYINAFLASWLSISYWEMLIYILIGDILWYALDVAMIFGVNTFVDAEYAMYFMVGISVVMIIGFGLLHKKMSRQFHIV